MCLPGLLAKSSEEIDQLLIKNVPETSEFHMKDYINSKHLRKYFSITWK